MATQLELTDKDYSWNNRDQVIIKNAGLIDALINDSTKMIDALSSHISPISLSNITVDEYGTVIVTDAAFKNAIESALPKGPGGLGDVNHQCVIFN